MKNEEITLISQSCTGATVNKKKTAVFAEKKSVKRSEFYSAAQVGMTAKKTFTVDEMEYENAYMDGEEPTTLEYNGKEYVILRTYELNGEVEIVCGVM